MSENGNGQSATPPYASWKSFTGFIDELAPKGLPHRIDYTVMPNRSGATQSALRVALAFLGLTVGDVPTDSMKELLARISHTSRLAVVGRATWLAVASGGAIMRRNIGPS